MAIAFVNTGTARSLVGATSLAVGMPVGFAANDLLIASVVWGDTVSTVTGMTGWTDLGLGLVADGTTGTAQVWWKISNGSEAPTLGWATSSKPIIMCAAYRGVDTTTPIAASGGPTLNAVSNANTPTPSVTNPNANAWAVGFFTTRTTTSANQNNTFTPDAAMTERADLNLNTASSPWVTMEHADSNGAVTAAAHSYTAVNTITGTHKFGTLIYIQPAAAGGIVPPPKPVVVLNAVNRSANW